MGVSPGTRVSNPAVRPGPGREECRDVAAAAAPSVRSVVGDPGARRRGRWRHAMEAAGALAPAVRASAGGGDRGAGRGGRRPPPSAGLPEAEIERRRVAAVDPAFDPTKAAGAIAGLVRDAEGRPVDG